MKIRKDTYHVKICPEFFFDGTRFKSKYAVWIYILLKLDNNYYMQNNIHKPIEVNITQLTFRLEVNESSVHRALNELIDGGFLRRTKKGEYYIEDEANVLRENFEVVSKKFVKVYNNFILNYLRNYAENVNALKIYYSLFYNNKLGKQDNEGDDVIFSRNKIAKELKMGVKTVRDAISYLWNIGLLNKDNEGYYSLKSQNYKDKAKIIPAEIKPVIKQNSIYRTEEIKPKNWVGNYINKDGTRICDLIYMKQFEDTGCVMTNWRPYSGIPLTKEQYEQQEDLKLFGRPKHQFDIHACNG